MDLGQGLLVPISSRDFAELQSSILRCGQLEFSCPGEVIEFRSTENPAVITPVSMAKWHGGGTQ